MVAALVPLLALQATLIAVKPSDSACPTTKQVSDAIAARLPGVLVPPEQSGLADTLLLVLVPDPVSRDQELTLVDRDQKVRLRRVLPPPASTADRECPALAETVALMIERYFQDLAYHGEIAAAPVTRRWDLFAGATWRPGADGLSAYDVRMGLGRLLGRGRLALALAVGIEGASQRDWPGASGRLRRYPAELRLLWRTTLGAMTLEAGPFAGAQLVVLDSHSASKTALDARVSPLAGATAGLRLALGRAAFLRAVASLGIAVLRYDFVTAEPDPTVRFGTERLWGKMGIEAGFSFW